jgi:glucosamine-6-phosphate deaminase
LNIQVFASGDQLDEACADLIGGMVRIKPRAVLGLATGGTPLGVYRRLIADHRNGLISFRQATTFNLDEYVGLPENHPESYRAYMRRNLFDHIDLPLSRAHLPDGNAADLEAECRRYDALIEEAGGIDLQLLGIGHNGHIGFNEPDRELATGTHVVDLAEETRRANARFFRSIDEVPRRAITMGVGTILKARTIVLMAKGADKADIVRRALEGPITTECPASLLQTHSQLIVLLDRGAAAKLSAASPNAALSLDGRTV